jgi:hypothetical protein
MAQNSKDTSEYLLTPITDWYLDIMVSRAVPSSEFDKIINIPPAFDQRPDLLSQQEYGTPALWWVFCVRNPDLIIDPIQDFIAGLEIYVPVNILKQ